MPDLHERYLEGSSEIGADRVKDLLTKGNKEAIVETLTRSGWEGQLIATVTLRVSVDGERVEDGQFNIRGNLCKEKVKVQAAKIWEKAEEDVTLEVEMPPG